MRLADLLALALAAVAYAQNTITVQVGGEATTNGGIFQFIPPTVNGSQGDIIMFQFTGAPGNHSITQSTFDDPCDPMDGGFDSGWVNIPANGVGVTPVWNLTITDASTPLWFFCKQLIPSPHCIAGMVGAINPPASGSNSFQAFQSKAHDFTGNPGQGVGALVGSGASASTIPGPLTDGAALAGTPAATATSPGGSSGGGASGSSGTSSGSSATKYEYTKLCVGDASEFVVGYWSCCDWHGSDVRGSFKGRDEYLS
ncbi:hypothetical protein BDZ89DRAFT_1035237 [Hymenopellis radicata]|nr:hypothetical protein BDZ89DRAFT_1035237 [Hymenopellis radicata]